MRQLERMAKINKYNNGGNEADLNPNLKIEQLDHVSRLLKMSLQKNKLKSYLKTLMMACLSIKRFGTALVNNEIELY